MRIAVFFSLKFQLVMGAVLLLTVTLLPISYLLIERQKDALVTDLDKTTVLQARNIARASAKALLRADPEFELLPLVERISTSSDNIVSLIITDSQGVIQADLALQNIGTHLDFDLKGYEPRRTAVLEKQEALYENAEALLLSTPIVGSGRTIGTVHMGYSKRELTSAVNEAVRMTLLYSAIALSLGIITALFMFRRISKPMDIMMDGVRGLGDGVLDTRIHVPTRNEFQVLAGAFNDMTARLLEAQQELVEKHVMDRELEIVHDIQSTLIPHDIRQPEGYAIRSHYQAAMQVGGDYVDVIQLDSRRIALLVADVSGKGVPGLVVMAMLKTLVHSISKTRHQPDEILRELNRALKPNMRSNMFVTMSLAVLDGVTGLLTCSSAGHNPLLVFDGASRKCSLRRIKGRPLGLFSDAEFYPYVHRHDHQLAPGDAVLLYTDGLNESMNGRRQQFGYARMLQIAAEYGSRGAHELVKRLVSAENRFRGNASQSDDLTLLALSAHHRTAAVSHESPRATE
jgi:sigma-B regulation protein RsbU (phosphoserine phosphatase)